MSKLHIDFAPRTPRRALYRAGLPAWLFGLAGLALCLGAALAAQRLMERIDTDRSTLQRVNAKQSARTRNMPVVKQTSISELQAATVNRAIAQLNLPWREVLDTAESATPKTIALLALEPDAKRNTLVGLAEAKTSDDMIAYIEQLKKQAFFTSVVLTRHEINEQDPNKPLRFQFEAQWPADAL